MFWFMRRTVEDLSEVHNGVACDRKRQLGLALTGAFETDDDKGAGIQNSCEGTEPGLVVVVRSKLSEHRISKMAFE